MLKLPPATASSLRVAIAGGGLMGHAIAAVMVHAGATVTVLEPDEDLRASLFDRMDVVLEECEGNNKASTSTTAVAALEDLPPETNLVIEAVPERLALKQDLFERLERQLPHAVLATNSSVYRVGDVSSRMDQTARAVGTHWWNPPHLVPLVEVIQGPQTSDELIAWTMEVLRSARKTPVHVRKDTPGFIGNRMQHALWREALALVEEGVADPETVDMVARSTLGLKLGVLGPLENADYVGLDLTFAIHEYVLPALSRSQTPSQLLQQALADGRLGAKNGAGLTVWPESRRSDVASRLAKHVRQQLTERVETSES